MNKLLLILSGLGVLFIGLVIGILITKTGLLDIASSSVRNISDFPTPSANDVRNILNKIDDVETTAGLSRDTKSNTYKEGQEDDFRYIRTDRRGNWRESPVQIQNLSLVIPKEGNEEATGMINQVRYYKLGTDSETGDMIVLVQMPCIGMCMDNGGQFLILYSEEKSYLLNANSTLDPVRESGFDYAWYKLSKKINTDNNIVYREILGPGEFAVKDEKFVSYSKGKPYFNVEADNTAKEYTIKKSVLTKLDDGIVERKMSYGEISDTNPETDYMGSFVLDLPAGAYVTYFQDFKSLMKDDGTPKFVWEDGTVNTDPYRFDGGSSCGGGGSAAYANRELIRDGDLRVVGTAPNGKVLYQFVSPYHQISFDYYNKTGGMYFDYNPVTHRNEEIKMSIEDWHNKKGLILYPDNLGEYVLFLNTKYGPAAECGKPVIYLYPEEETNVDLSVDASVTLSEPHYEKGVGWKSVLAKPSGELVYKNKKYNSLFWEGIGNGEYPDVTGVGRLVESRNIKDELSYDLKRLGLNDKEAKDFMDFWLPRMPKTKYTRLTWFGTREMDKLAPLTITPEPDTSIRVFLDFEGLNHKVKLKEQNLSSVKRKGFTLVEWGGLLR